MRAFTFKEYIERPPAKVWEVLVDLPLAPRWRPLIKSMETDDGQPLRQGSRVRITIELTGRMQSRTSTTVVFDPPRQWKLHSSDSPQFEGFFDFQLEPRGTGTSIVATCDLLSHGFLPTLFLPLVAYGERQRRTEMLRNLKRLIEGGSV